MIPRQSRRRWLILGLVFAFMLVNYADKAVIGLSAVSIMAELHLTGTAFGALGSAFFLLFAVSGVVGGALGDRIPSRVLLTTLAVVWAAAQAPMIGAVSFTTLVMARVALGAGEGPAFPLALHTTYRWFEDGRRTLPSGIVASGAAVGAGILAPALTFVITHMGWHAAFGVLAVASLVWAAAWALWGGDGPIEPGGVSDAARGRTIPLLRSATSRTAIGVYLGGFAAYWALTLNIVWLAAFLIKSARFSPMAAGWILVLPSLTQILLAPTIGAWADRRVRAGMTSRHARGFAGAACLILAGIAMALVPLLADSPLEIPLVAIAFSIGSVFFTLSAPVVAEVAPVGRTGAMLGLTNAIHSLAGLVAPLAMGVLVDVAADPVSGFRTGLIAAGAFVALCGLAAGALIDPSRDAAPPNVETGNGGGDAALDRAAAAHGGAMLPNRHAIGMPAPSHLGRDRSDERSAMVRGSRGVDAGTPLV